jgi:hypothetical protein
VCLTLAAVTACSDDGATPAGTTLSAATDAAGCVAMPTVDDLSAMVGVPLAEGRVTGAGTCEYLALDDEHRSLVLVLLTDPVDQAAFADAQASAGVPTPLDDPELAGASVAASSAVYITANGALYSVLTTVTDAPPAEQVPLSVIVLERWLAL